MNRELICYSDGENGQTAIRSINGYCCNVDAQIIQIQVVEDTNGKTTIYALVDYDYTISSSSIKL